jgi:hypothetical protein
MLIYSLSVEVQGCTEEATLVIQDTTAQKQIMLTGNTVKCKATFEFGQNSKYALKVG